MKRRTDGSTYRALSPDTDLWAERMLFEHWRVMEPCEKARLVSDLSASVHRLSCAGLAERFPDATPSELERKAAALRLGPELWKWVEALERSAS